MDLSREPSLTLARKVLPKPLFQSIEALFKQKITQSALVGGTALAGFYAGHRRSDDMDIFAGSENAFRAAMLAAKNLRRLGVILENETESKQFYHALAIFKDHRFTVDIVLDANLFKVGEFVTLDNGIAVPNLETLLKMKATTLVSRCAEKDLYDLLWFHREIKPLTASHLVELGKQIDAGMNAENILSSLLGTKPREDACSFGIDSSQHTVFANIMAFRKKLIEKFHEHLKNLPTPLLGKAIKRTK